VPDVPARPHRHHRRRHTTRSTLDTGMQGNEPPARTTDMGSQCLGAGLAPELICTVAVIPAARTTPWGT
jgi:hypothetical protein